MYSEEPSQRHGWIVWVLLGLLLVMAAGYWAMSSGAQGQLPEVVEATSPSPVPTPTPTPVLPSPTPEAESIWEEEENVESSTLEVEDPPEEELPEEPEVEEESEPLEVSDPEWYLRLVNRDHPIPEAYPQELWEVPGGQLVDARIYEPLMTMLQDAEALDLGPIVVAGYRTWEKQQSIMDERVADYVAQGYSEEEARTRAEQWVSVPGGSEHQLGLAVDINGAVSDIYPWLQEHSWEYGFIQRYPADKVEITGCQEEEWHYRYVGVDAAWDIYWNGLCLEEYLEQRGGN